ncbi:hypothetical protein BV22DRAFT_1040657 [Leucogyrophana mollusca]|uniref:Uncharacterized protein n=1 Tax=Leucogyrophana mollusca TaxID=85980 RepID=A0ACB8B4N4_9AGAM|nr:hypothetical protein BV22DRAFT_1040657 [Leucogyrophana mollusca]
MYPSFKSSQNLILERHRLGARLKREPYNVLLMSNERQKLLSKSMHFEVKADFASILPPCAYPGRL